MAKKKSSETPLMQQYYALKAEHPTALLLFRVGDFYETFGEDAIKASQILGITLTKRANGTASHIELAGFPYHSIDAYMPKLIRAGIKVAVCEQLEDPKLTKKIVKRGITELITPGTAIYDKSLDSQSNNYLCAIHQNEHLFGIAFLDLSTGEFSCTQAPKEIAKKLIDNYLPSELILPKNNFEPLKSAFAYEGYASTLEPWLFEHIFAEKKLCSHFETQNLKGFGVEGLNLAIAAAGAIIHYLEANKHEKLNHITQLSRIDQSNSVWLDGFTIRNLELIQSNHPNGTSLFDVLNKTQTPMGARLLKKWLLTPLVNLNHIQDRQNKVDFLLANHNALQEMQTLLNGIGDFERLISKIALNRCTPRELKALEKNILSIQNIKLVLQKLNKPEFNKLNDRLQPCQALLDILSSNLVDEPPVAIAKGNVIKSGVNGELDSWRNKAYNSKDILLQIQKNEAIKTGISSLKISFNNVFGYYLEVTNVHKDKVPESWIRKQTLVNAERYITPELKEYEEDILKADGEILRIETELYQQLINEVNQYTAILQQNALEIAHLDILCCFAEVALQHNYIKPQINQSHSISIKEGRHPVIEQNMPKGEEYIPNSVELDNNTQQIIILTGPNMSGKSAILRQTALITLMAQVGCFVPAKEALIGIVDKIFTRVGASDNLAAGESTFMVEMSETANILNNLSDRSLIILDEIGRGTSTFDGISIAWAITEYLHQHPYQPKTIFATHYHELNDINLEDSRIAPFHVSVVEKDGKIIFLRKLKRGGSEHSFGIHVAKMAGVPQTVTQRANEILARLEDSRISTDTLQKATNKMGSIQLKLFPYEDPKLKSLEEELSKIDINTLTPVEALLKISRLQEILKKSQS